MTESINRPLSRHSNMVRCACGGWLSCTSEPLYGRTVEVCSGPCHYEGPPRPQLETALPLAERIDGKRPCREGCGRGVRSVTAQRCEECAAEAVVKRAAYIAERSKRLWQEKLARRAS